MFRTQEILKKKKIILFFLGGGLWVKKLNIKMAYTLKNYILSSLGYTIEGMRMYITSMGIAPEFSNSVQSNIQCSNLSGCYQSINEHSERCRRGVRAHFLNALV